MTELIRIQPPLMPFSAGINIPVRHLSLNNGAALFLIEAGKEDVMRIEFIFNAGIRYENIPLVATTTNIMLTEGSEKHSAQEINEILDYYGIFLNSTYEKDKACLTLYFLTRFFHKVLEIIDEILFHPSFPEKELDTLLKKRLSWYRINKQKVQNLASDHFFESIFGADHPYGRQIQESDFGKIDTALLKNFHSSHYCPEKMTIIVTGRIPENTAELIGEFFGRLNSDKALNEENVIPVHGETLKKRNIVKTGSIQTSFRIGSVTINKRDPDYPGLKILNVILGGYFGSRLMKNLREEKGFTYGIHSSVSSLELSGFKIISTEVGKEYANQAADEIYKEIKLLQAVPVSSNELEVVRNFMAGEMVRMFDGPFAIAESFKSVWEFGLDVSYFRRFMEKIRTIQPEEIMQIAQKYYNIEDLYEVTAG